MTTLDSYTPNASRLELAPLQNSCFMSHCVN
jgi:hypothetical protein